MKREMKLVRFKTRRMIPWIAGTVFVLAGCSGAGEMVRMQNTSTRTEVYGDVRGSGPVPPGDADLLVSFSMKTHEEGFHVLEKGTRGTPNHVVLLNVDGQVEELTGEMALENTLDERPRTPETGNGIRYVFRKGIRVKAGYHKVFISVPGEEVAIEKEVRLDEGTRNELVLDPVYSIGKRFGKRAPNFYSHLTGIRPFLNGKPL